MKRSCPSCIETMLDLVYQPEALSALERRDLEQHLRACDDCRREQSHLLETHALMQALPSLEPQRGIEAILQGAARATRLREEQKPNWLVRLGAKLRDHPLGMTAALAATVTLLVVGQIPDHDFQSLRVAPDATLAAPTAQPQSESIERPGAAREEETQRSDSQIKLDRVSKDFDAPLGLTDKLAAAPPSGAEPFGGEARDRALLESAERSNKAVLLKGRAIAADEKSARQRAGALAPMPTPSTGRGGAVPRPSRTQSARGELAPRAKADIRTVSKAELSRTSSGEAKKQKAKAARTQTSSPTDSSGAALRPSSRGAARGAARLEPSAQSAPSAARGGAGPSPSSVGRRMAGRKQAKTYREPAKAPQGGGRLQRSVTPPSPVVSEVDSVLSREEKARSQRQDAEDSDLDDLVASKGTAARPVEAPKEALDAPRRAAAVSAPPPAPAAVPPAPPTAIAAVAASVAPDRTGAPSQSRARKESVSGGLGQSRQALKRVGSLVATGRCEAAMPLIRSLIHAASSADRAAAYLYRGQCKERVGDHSEARSDFAMAVALEGGRYSRAARRSLKRLDRSRAVMLDAAEGTPKSAETGEDVAADAAALPSVSQ